MNFEIALMEDKTTCCGCGVCAALCPSNAISMVEDQEGFLYPQINNKVCLKCGLCLRNCNFKLRQNNKAINRLGVGQL